MAQPPLLVVSCFFFSAIIIASRAGVNAALPPSPNECSASGTVKNGESVPRSILSLGAHLGQDSTTPPTPPGRGASQELREAYDESMLEYYRYKAAMYRHSTLVYKWQLASSKIIFQAVVALVIVGVLMTLYQLVSPRLFAVPSSEPHTKLEPIRTSDSVSSTTLQISSSGLSISSPLIGVVILALSFGFFYAYLVHIYPITFAGPSGH